MFKSQNDAATLIQDCCLGDWVKWWNSNACMLNAWAAPRRSGRLGRAAAVPVTRRGPAAYMAPYHSPYACYVMV